MGRVQSGIYRHAIDRYSVFTSISTFAFGCYAFKCLAFDFFAGVDIDNLVCGHRMRLTVIIHCGTVRNQFYRSVPGSEICNFIIPVESLDIIGQRCGISFLRIIQPTIFHCEVARGSVDILLCLDALIRNLIVADVIMLFGYIRIVMILDFVQSEGHFVEIVISVRNDI